MFFTTNLPNPEPVNAEAIEALTQFIAGERAVKSIVKLSDVDRSTMLAARPLWQKIPTDGRRFVIRQMLEQAEQDVACNFSRMFLLALDDPDGEVRSIAVQGLWEDESTTSLERLLRMLEVEREPIVREVIVEAIGTFSLLAFEEAISPHWGDEIRRVLLEVFHSNEPIGVRKKALISLACFSGNPEIESAIRDSFESAYEDLQSAAIFAMGLNLSDQWFDILLDALSDSEPELRFEAVRAIGRYGDERASSPVLDLLNDEDREVQLAAIESLGEIGGTTAVSTLRRLTSSDDIAVREAADDALHGATIARSPIRYNP